MAMTPEWLQRKKAALPKPKWEAPGKFMQRFGSTPTPTPGSGPSQGRDSTRSTRGSVSSRNISRKTSGKVSDTRMGNRQSAPTQQRNDPVVGAPNVSRPDREPRQDRDTVDPLATAAQLGMQNWLTDPMNPNRVTGPSQQRNDPVVGAPRDMNVVVAPWVRQYSNPMHRNEHYYQRGTFSPITDENFFRRFTFPGERITDEHFSQRGTQNAYSDAPFVPNPSDGGGGGGRGFSSQYSGWGGGYGGGGGYSYPSYSQSPSWWDALMGLGVWNIR